MCKNQRKIHYLLTLLPQVGLPIRIEFGLTGLFVRTFLSLVDLPGRTELMLTSLKIDLPTDV